MLPSHLNDCLTVLGWDAEAFAAQLGCHSMLVRQWMRGTSKHGVPGSFASWLERRTGAARTDPAPTSWRTRNGRLAPQRPDCSPMRVAL